MNIARHLASIKLDETARQRERLHRAYDAVETGLAGISSPLERLRFLQRGLSAIRFGNKRLHPQAEDIDALFLADSLGSAPPELVADRTAMLERELAQARLRAEFTYAFGSILNQSTEHDETAYPVPPAADAIESCFAPGPPIDEAYLRARLDSLEPMRDATRKSLMEALGEVRPFDGGEIDKTLARIVRDPYETKEVKSQAARVSADRLLANELCGVMTIQLNRLSEWGWPKSGAGVRAVWTRSRYRHWVECDLLDRVFLHLIGYRIGIAFRESIRWWTLTKAGRRLWVPPRDPVENAREIARLNLQDGCLLPMIAGGRDNYGPDALLHQLHGVERELGILRTTRPDRPAYVLQFDLKEYYGSLDHSLILRLMEHLGLPQTLLEFVGVWLKVPVREGDSVRTVQRGCLLDFYLSDLAGELVMFLLDVHLRLDLGVSPIRVVDDIFLVLEDADTARKANAAVRAFVKAMGLSLNESKCGFVAVGPNAEPVEGMPTLRPRWGMLRLMPTGVWEIDEPAFANIEAIVRTQSAAIPSVLGLVACWNGYLRYLFKQLALSLRLSGDHLGRASRRLMRMHDHLFGEGHGMPEEIRRRLSSLFVDIRLKENGLPPVLIYWPITAGGLALLHPQLHVAALVERPPIPLPVQAPDRAAILERLQVQAQYTSNAPVDSRTLLKAIRQAAGQPMNLEQIERAITPEDPFGGEDPFSDPFGGGDPFGSEESYVEYTDREYASAERQLWWDYVNGLVRSVVPSAPSTNPAMERLVSDFIARGSEVGGRVQVGLSPYWRWVIYAYGPSLIESLGTFRFLMTELVPLELILQSLGSSATAGEN